MAKYLYPVDVRVRERSKYETQERESGRIELNAKETQVTELMIRNLKRGCGTHQCSRYYARRQARLPSPREKESFLRRRHRCHTEEDEKNGFYLSHSPTNLSIPSTVKGGSRQYSKGIAMYLCAGHLTSSLPGFFHHTRTFQTPSGRRQAAFRSRGAPR